MLGNPAVGGWLNGVLVGPAFGTSLVGTPGIGGRLNGALVGPILGRPVIVVGVAFDGVA